MNASLVVYANHEPSIQHVDDSSGDYIQTTFQDNIFKESFVVTKHTENMFVMCVYVRVRARVRACVSV